MRKLFKKIKKIFVLLIILTITLNPLVFAVALAEEAVLTTEPAVSVSTAVSETNTTSQDSSIDTEVVVIDSQTEPVVTPFPLSSPTLTPSATPSLSPTPDPSTSPIPSPTPSPSPSGSITVENQATSETQSAASSDTGQNDQETTGDGAVTTGDAVALATATSLTNTTLIDSIIQVGVIAILSGWNGDIVIDPPAQNQGSTGGATTVAVTNSATSVETETIASVSTGDNSQIASGSANMETGEAIALTQSNVVVNTTLVGADIFTLNPSNLWLWTGSILNWEGPGSINDPSAISNISSTVQGECNQGCETDLSVINEAEVKTSAIASASTGDNTQIASGSAEMTTGNAYAGAVSTVIVNTTLVNSRYRLLSLLLFSPWSGNLIFAYPDLQVMASAPAQVYEGEQIPYNVTIKNRGYAKASKIDLLKKITNSEQLVYEHQENWDSIGPGESIVSTFSFPTDGRGGHTIRLAATATNGSLEESSANNAATTSTIVLSRPSNSSGTGADSTEVPTLRLSSLTNINEFVYPGDGVTFDLTIVNDGPISARNLRLTQIFYSPSGTAISTFQGKIGELSLNQRKTIRFVMALGSTLPAGTYHTEAYVYGESEHGAATNSNTVSNILKLKLKSLITKTIPGTVTPALAMTPEDTRVLGAAIASSDPIRCNQCTSFPWYIAITLGSMIYYTTTFRHKNYAQSMRFGLALPLSAYVGLLMSNPGCSHGISMLSGAASACQWFLPIAIAIYLVIMWPVQIRQRSLSLARG